MSSQSHMTNREKPEDVLVKFRWPSYWPSKINRYRVDLRNAVRQARKELLIQLCNIEGDVYALIDFLREIHADAEQQGIVLRIVGANEEMREAIRRTRVSLNLTTKEEIQDLESAKNEATESPNAGDLAADTIRATMAGGRLPPLQGKGKKLVRSGAKVDAEEALVSVLEGNRLVSEEMEDEVIQSKKTRKPARKRTLKDYLILGVILAVGTAIVGGVEYYLVFSGTVNDQLIAPPSKDFESRKDKGEVRDLESENRRLRERLRELEKQTGNDAD